MNRLYFNEPRLKLSAWGDFWVRVVTYCVYIIFIISVPVLLFSDLARLQWLGLLISLFLGDRLLHFGQAEKTLTELKRSSKKENIALYMTPGVKQILIYTYRKSLSFNQNFYLLLLKELIEKEEIKEILKRLEIKKSELEQKINKDLVNSSEVNNKKDLLLKIEELAKKSCEEAVMVEERFIETRNLFSALMAGNDPLIIKLLDFFNLSSVDFREAAIFGRYHHLFKVFKKLPTSLGEFSSSYPYHLSHRVMNRAWTARPTPLLDKFSTDLTDLARSRKIGFLIGHQKEFQQLLDILSQAIKPNALLVGEPLVGKTTIVAHLAFCLTKDLVPSPLFDKRLVSLNLSSLMAKATPDILASRLKQIMDEIYWAGNIILHLPNLGDFFKTTGEGVLSPIDIILPLLKTNEVPVIGEISPQLFKEVLEKNDEVNALFKPIRVEEISKEEAVRFLVYDSLILEKKFKIFITFKAIKKTVELAHRYFRSKLLPSSAEEILNQALEEGKRRRLKILDEDLVTAVVEEKIKIPLQRVSTAEAETLLNLEELIHQRLINQNQAVKAVAEALRQYRAGLKRKGGPIASFLFVGPTGVGKTELSKILAKIQFGSEEMMIRFDMSEYQQKNTISRFLGTSEGGMVNSLTEAVLQRPYSLILLDEFEKAHPDILNLFLQVFDDGRLTDSLGRTVDFQNTIIIATSNAHSDFIKTELEKGKTIEEIEEELKKKLTTIFRPELLNRFSDIIVFRNLNLEEIILIAKIQLKDLAQTLKEAQGITISFEEAVVAKLAELGFDPIFGARPLRQVISEKIKSVLAKKILEKEISRGDRVEVVWENNKFCFKIKR